MKNLVVALLLFSVTLVGCGGSKESNTPPQTPGPAPSGPSTPGPSSPDPTPPSGNAGEPTMKPNTTIAVGRSLNVLVLTSNASDQRKLRRDELVSAFNIVEAVSVFNELNNSYTLTYAEYDTAQTTKQMYDYYNETQEYPEGYALAQSQWLEEESNLALFNDADIVVLRTSFDSLTTNGGFWGAGTGSVQLWTNLRDVPGIDKETMVFNTPVDPNDNNQPYLHNNYLDDKLKLTRYDYIFAHEFIHALGYGAHDNGVDLHQTETFSERVRDDLSYSGTVGNTLSYGDCFSVMGNGDCSLMLSPSAKELLGVNLDSISVYKDATVTLKGDQVLKIFLNETTGITGYEKIVTYLTVAKPKIDEYGKSLLGDIDLSGIPHSLQANREGYLIRLVTVDISHEATPNVVLLDASPPLNDVQYTLQSGSDITVGNKIKLDFRSSNDSTSEFAIKYLE